MDDPDSSGRSIPRSTCLPARGHLDRGFRRTAQPARVLPRPARVWRRGGGGLMRIGFARQDDASGALRFGGTDFLVWLRQSMQRLEARIPAPHRDPPRAAADRPRKMRHPCEESDEISGCVARLCLRAKARGHSPAGEDAYGSAFLFRFVPPLTRLPIAAYRLRMFASAARSNSLTPISLTSRSASGR
jgi:hypothetical protein